jgi:hypothetical protein
MSETFYFYRTTSPSYTQRTGCGLLTNPFVIEPAGTGTGDADRAKVVTAVTGIWAAMGQPAPTFVDLPLPDPPDPPDPPRPRRPTSGLRRGLTPALLYTRFVNTPFIRFHPMPRRPR